MKRDHQSLLNSKPPSTSLLHVNDDLPSSLTFLVLALPLHTPVYEMQTKDLITIAQASPQPQPVTTANYSRVNPLHSHTTSSSSSGKLHCDAKLCLQNTITLSITCIPSSSDVSTSTTISNNHDSHSKIWKPPVPAPRLQQIPQPPPYERLENVYGQLPVHRMLTQKTNASDAT